MPSLALFQRFAFCLLLGALWSGCQPESWDLGAPEVLEISEYTLTTTPLQGTAQHGVEEVWVYSATDVLGVYPLPARVTLPAGEPQTLTLLARHPRKWGGRNPKRLPLLQSQRC